MRQTIASLKFYNRQPVFLIGVTISQSEVVAVSCIGWRAAGIVDNRLCFACTGWAATDWEYRAESAHRGRG